MKIIIILSFILIANCSSTAKSGIPHTYLESVNTEPVKPLLEQANLSLELQNERVTAKSEESYFLGIALQDGTLTFPNIIDFNSPKREDFRSVTLSAAYVAQRKANADGIHLVRVTETREGFFPFYWKNISQVVAFPLILKSNSSLQTTSKPTSSSNEDANKKGKK
jgi:hypothetical protein